MEGERRAGERDSDRAGDFAGERAGDRAGERAGDRCGEREWLRGVRDREGERRRGGGVGDLRRIPRHALSYSPSRSETYSERARGLMCAVQGAGGEAQDRDGAGDAQKLLWGCARRGGLGLSL